MKKMTILLFLTLFLIVSPGFAQQTPTNAVDGDNNNFDLNSTSLEYTDFWKHVKGGFRR